MNAEHAGQSGRTDAALTAFIAGLRCKTTAVAEPVPLPEIGQTGRQVAADDDLETRFAKAAMAAGMTVHRVSPATWVDELMRLAGELKAGHVLVAAQDGSALASAQAAVVGERLSAAGVTVHTDLSDDTLFSVDVAVTGVSAGIAETGTIVATSGPGLARASSLIPPLHVAVVLAEQIVPDLHDYFALLDAGALPAGVHLISGPSKTADIEGILVTGVHGPAQVHILLVSRGA
ncbi:MAG: lactate utilization protein [Phycisphaerae bacterium]|jgi:L-lactate utilization protein LutC